MLKRIITLPVLATVLTAGVAVTGAEAQYREFEGEIELVDPDSLRVCADPNNMPFSNEAGEGFEQAVARLLSHDLERDDVTYSFFPQATGFVRMTLGSMLCDVIMSAPQGDEITQNTNGYYRTAYTLVYPDGGELEGVDRLSDPKLKDKRIGVVAGTPPASYLAREGLLGQAKPYHLFVDTRVNNSAREMMADLASGEIDAAVLWGPLAGYHAKLADADYDVVPLVNEGRGPATAYRITMGVRAADQQWKRRLNIAIRDNQEAINDILLAYGVPLLDENNQPILSTDGRTAQEIPLPSDLASFDGLETDASGNGRAAAPDAGAGEAAAEPEAASEPEAGGEPAAAAAGGNG